MSAIHKSMRLRHATAPLQEHVIETVGDLLTGRHEEVPEDGYDRVDYRLEIVFAAYDDDEPDDPAQPCVDLLSDVLHLCEAKGWSIDTLLSRAAMMVAREQGMWGER